MLPDPAICLVTDDETPPERVVAVVDAACRAGCRFVQLRRRAATARDLWALARTLTRATAAVSATLSINDRADVALACDVPGLHLPAAGMPSHLARELMGPTARLGRSVHSIDEIRALVDAPVDYVQFGPIYETSSKRRYGAPQGLAMLERAVDAAGARPVVAVGGIDADRVHEVLASGARGIAVMGAIMRSADPYAATAALIEKLTRG